MRVLKVIFALLLVALVIAAVAAPIGPMPGIVISGTAVEVPTKWGDTSHVHEIQLQIGDGPFGRTVNIWTVQIDGDLYVTGQKDSGWIRGIGAGSLVRMQMEGNLYELTASPITEGQVEVITAWLEKYAPHYPDIMDGFPAPEDSVRTSAVVRLTARS